MSNSKYKAGRGRPPCCRCVARDYELQIYKPAGIPFNQLTEIELGIDELEAIRLIDVEGLYHEDAAHRMHISRSTLGRILRNGHEKVARAILEAQALVIRGGNIEYTQQKHNSTGAADENRNRQQ